MTDVSQAFCDIIRRDGGRPIATVDASSASLLEYAPAADPDVDAPLLFGSTRRLTGAVTLPDGRRYDVARCTRARFIIQLHMVQ